MRENPAHLASGRCIPGIFAQSNGFKPSIEIATCFGGCIENDAECRANACLIAAAPTLLRERNEARRERDELVRLSRLVDTARVSGSNQDLWGSLNALNSFVNRIEGGAQ
jgi:hypothetical protein